MRGTGAPGAVLFLLVAGETDLDQVPYLGQVKLPGPVGDVGAVDLVAADLSRRWGWKSRIGG